MATDSDGPLPGAADFSKEAVSKAVLKEVAGSPFVVIPAALGVVGLAAFLASAAIPASVVYLLMGGGGIGAGMFLLNFFGRRDVLVAHYLQQLNASTRDQSKVLAASLQEEFTELRFPRGQEQIKLLQTHLATIKTLLGDKFDKGDTSYEQFLGPAEQLVAKTLNVLKDAAAQLRANQTFDQDYGRKTPKGGNGSADRRKDLYDDGVKHFNELIEKVEAAITGLAELTHDVARIGSDAGSHDDFIQRVKDIASRAGLYVDEKKL